VKVSDNCGFCYTFHKICTSRQRSPAKRSIAEFSPLRSGALAIEKRSARQDFEWRITPARNDPCFRPCFRVHRLHRHSGGGGVGGGRATVALVRRSYHRRTGIFHLMLSLDPPMFSSMIASHARVLCFCSSLNPPNGFGDMLRLMFCTPCASSPLVLHLISRLF
jgi:hypothetical protein